MPLHKVHSNTLMREDRAASYNGYNSSYNDFNISRLNLDDGTSSVSDVSSSTGLSRHTSSVASVRSLDARSRPASQGSHPLSQASSTFAPKFSSLAARIAYDERQKKLAEQLKRLQSDEQERVTAEQLALPSIRHDHEQVVSRPDTRQSTMRRASTVSSLAPDRERPESRPEPQPEHSPEIEQRFNIDELVQFENNDLRSPPPTYESHWNDLEEILNLEMRVQGNETAAGLQEDPKTISAISYEIPLPDMLELPSQWNEPLELLHIEPERPPMPKVAELSPSSASPLPAELSPSTYTAELSPSPISVSATELPPSPLLRPRMHASSLPNLEEYQELEGSVFAEIDSIIANLPSRSKSTFAPAPVFQNEEPFAPAASHKIASFAPAISQKKAPRAPAAPHKIPPRAPVAPHSTAPFAPAVPHSTTSIAPAIPHKTAPRAPAAPHRRAPPAPSVPPKIAPEPPQIPYPSVNSVASNRKHWLSQASAGSISRPHSHLPPRPSYAELPTADISSLPYPTATPDQNLFPAPEPIPVPPPFTFELSASHSVIHRARAQGVHEKYRRVRHHSDLEIYNTHTHDSYPLMEAEERFEMPARPYESDRRDLYSWDRDAYAPEVVVQPDFDPLTGRASGT